MMRLYTLILIGLLLNISTTHAQSWEGSNTGKIILINIGYGPQVPLADLEQRFGLSFSPEVSIDYLTEKNWVWGLQAQYLFGSDVKQDVLAGLRTEAGDIIGNDREPADIQLRERGYYIGLRVGKLIALSEKNERSGIRFNLGAGLLQHKIRFQGDPFRSVVQIEGDYEKGYDRLTNGLALHQFIGYQAIGRTNGIHVTGGFDFLEGFTQNRRDFNFDTQSGEAPNRLDVLVGFRLSISIPFFLGNAEDIYY